MQEMLHYFATRASILLELNSPTYMTLGDGLDGRLFRVDVARFCRLVCRLICHHYG